MNWPANSSFCNIFLDHWYNLQYNQDISYQNMYIIHKKRVWVPGNSIEITIIALKLQLINKLGGFFYEVSVLQ